MTAVVLLGGCSTVPLRSTVAANPRGSISILVGAEQGLPPNPRAARRLVDAWSAAATRACAGAYVGAPDIQVTSYAAPGQPFADPSAPGVSLRYTAALGSVTCAGLIASIDP
jgi:hypothetical protein